MLGFGSNAKSGCRKYPELHFLCTTLTTERDEINLFRSCSLDRLKLAIPLLLALKYVIRLNVNKYNYYFSLLLTHIVVEEYVTIAEKVQEVLYIGRKKLKITGILIRSC